MPNNHRENQNHALCAHVGLVGGITTVKFKCPCHGDKTASGVASLGDDGRVLLKCHGCDADYADILAAWGFKKEDAFPPDQSKQPSNPKPKPKFEAEYQYSPNSKKIKLRYPDGSKSCFWQHLKGTEWVNGRGGEPLALFSNGIQSDVVFIVEGEGDALAMKLLGLSAYSLPDGAKSKWLPQYADTFKAKTVYIIQDNDSPGKEFAQMLAAALQGIAATVKVFDLTESDPELPPKADISDAYKKWGAEETLGALNALSVVTPEWEPSLAPATTDQPRSDIKKDYSGELISIGIVKSALHDLGITVRYNQLLKEAEIRGLPSCYSTGNAVNILPAYLMDYLKGQKVKGVTQQTIDLYLSCIADECRYNPLLELLSTCAWDGADRLSEVYDILGVIEPKHQTYIKKWLIQCITLGLNDEKNPVGAEGVLVLQGAQGLAKTSFFRIITPNPRWFCEGAVIDVGVKDTIMHATGAWITELGELDSTLKREQSALKAFISRSEDRIRAPYAKSETQTPRRTSFCGTVNPADYLRDETGSRRFWTIPVTSIDKKTLFSLPKTWPKQLWAQVYKLYQENPNGFRLTDDEMRQLESDNKTFSVPLPYEIEVRELLNYSLPVDRWRWCRANEIRKFLPTNADARKVGKALKKIVDEQSTTPYLTPLKNPRIKDGNNEYFIPLKQINQNSAWQVG